MRGPYCLCRCHSTARGNYNAERHRENVARDAYDADPVSPWNYRRLNDASAHVKACSQAITLNVVHGVDCADPIEAARACPDCLKHHTPALLARVIWGPQIVKAEWSDPKPEHTNPDISQADGGEGPET